MKKKILVLSVMLFSLVSCQGKGDITSSTSSSTTSSDSSVISSSTSSVSSTTIVSSSTSSSSTSSSSSSSSTQVDSDIHVTSISITDKSITTLKVGQVLQLSVEVLPKNATNKLVNYRSSNESVVSVSFNGLITARSTGDCTIYAVSDDGELSDSITFNVVASTVTSFTADFDSSVETIVSNKNTFYKLELGQSYPLTVSFNSTDEADNILEASFSVDGCCSFDSSTNTLTPLKKTGSVVLTLKVKGTNLKKEYYLKVVNPGEKDVSEVIAKLDSSIEKEKKLTVNTYDVNLHFNTLDINDNRTDAVQSTKFKIYKDTTMSSKSMIMDNT